MIGGRVELGAEGYRVFGEIGKKAEREENPLRYTLSVAHHFLFLLIALLFKV